MQDLSEKRYGIATEEDNMRRRTFKNKFALLPDEYKDAITSMSLAEIKQKIAQVAISQVELAQAKKNDYDLQEKREALRYAMEVYRDEAKLNKLKIEFANLMSENRR